jgi:hypothetical protein
MATDKKYNVFGTTKLNGEYKVRFANDIMRTKVLAKHGHTEIELVEMDQAMTKYEGIQAIKGLPEFANAASQAAITEYLDEKAPKATAVVKAVTKATTAKATKAPKAAPAVIEDENAPFTA